MSDEREDKHRAFIASLAAFAGTEPMEDFATLIGAVVESLHGLARVPDVAALLIAYGEQREEHLRIAAAPTAPPAPPAPTTPSEPAP